MYQISLLLMCENQGTRRGLSAIFAKDSDFDIMGELDCSADSEASAQAIQPDAIIYEDRSNEKIDIKIKYLKETCPYTKVFIFIDTLDEAYRAIAAGADGYLTKTMLPGDLAKVVDLTCRAGVLCLPCFLSGKDSILESTFNKINNNKKKISTSTNGDNGKAKWKHLLTAREMEIYDLVIQSYSNKEIGNKLFISQPTVKSHVSSILRKMGLNTRTQMVLFEMQNKGVVQNLVELSEEGDTKQTSLEDVKPVCRHENIV